MFLCAAHNGWFLSHTHSTLVTRSARPVWWCSRGTGLICSINICVTNTSSVSQSSSVKSHKITTFICERDTKPALISASVWPKHNVTLKMNSHDLKEIKHIWSLFTMTSQEHTPDVTHTHLTTSSFKAQYFSNSFRRTQRDRLRHVETLSFCSSQSQATIPHSQEVQRRGRVWLQEVSCCLWKSLSPPL